MSRPSVLVLFPGVPSARDEDDDVAGSSTAVDEAAAAASGRLGEKDSGGRNRGEKASARLRWAPLMAAAAAVARRRWGFMMIQ